MLVTMLVAFVLNAEPKAAKEAVDIVDPKTRKLADLCIEARKKAIEDARKKWSDESQRLQIMVQENGALKASETRVGDLQKEKSNTRANRKTSVINGKTTIDSRGKRVIEKMAEGERERLSQIANQRVYVARTKAQLDRLQSSRDLILPSTGMATEFKDVDLETVKRIVFPEKPPAKELKEKTVVDKAVAKQDG